MLPPLDTINDSYWNATSCIVNPEKVTTTNLKGE